MSNQVSIKVDTVDGTATEGSDYRGIHEVFTMEPHQTELPIQVEIGEEFDNRAWSEPSQRFIIKAPANQPFAFDLCIGIQISHLLIVG